MTPRASGSLSARVRALPRVVVWVAAAVVGVVALALVVALAMTSRPAFLGGYHSLEDNYASLQASAHSELRCGQCHVDSRGPVVSEALLVGEFYRGLYSRPDSPAFVQLTTPTRDACLSCHRNDWSEDASRTANVPHPAHLRVADEPRDCVECHKWTAHEEDYIERHKQMPFSTVCASFGCHVGWKTTDECGTCHHSLQEDKGEWRLIHKETVQAAGENGCLETCHDADQCRLCHTTGEVPDFSTTALAAGLEAIERDHVKADWLEKHGTTALVDDSKCFACHVSTGECDDCHARRPAFHGLESTWLTRHKDLSKDERRCLTCHEKKWCDECHDQFKKNS